MRVDVNSNMQIKSTTPILSSSDKDKAKEFYVNFLEFEIEFEHRFEENFPLYLGLIKGGFRLHLSEHYGDSNPGAPIRIEIENLELFQKALLNKNYKYSRPSIIKQDWGTMEMIIKDPFGNKLIFSYYL